MAAVTEDISVLLENYKRGFSPGSDVNEIILCVSPLGSVFSVIALLISLVCFVIRGAGKETLFISSKMTISRLLRTMVFLWRKCNILNVKPWFPAERRTCCLCNSRRWSWKWNPEGLSLWSSCCRHSVVSALHPVHPAKCPLRPAKDGGSATGTCWLNTRRQNKQTQPPPTNPAPMVSTFSVINHPNLSGMHNWHAQLHGRWRARTVGGAAEQCGRTKGRLSRERSDAGSNGLLNQTLAGGGCLKS